MARDVTRLFKSGNNFKFKSIDYSLQEQQRELEELKKEQDYVEKSQYTTLERMRKITFTI
jgi:hypothetical protein